MKYSYRNRNGQQQNKSNQSLDNQTLRRPKQRKKSSIHTLFMIEIKKNHITKYYVVFFFFI